MPQQRHNRLFVVSLALLAALAELLGGRFDVPVPLGSRSVPNPAMAAWLVLVPLLAYGLREAAGARSAVVYALAVLGGMAALLEALTWSRTPSGETDVWRALVTNGRDFDGYLIVPYLLLLGLLAWRRFTVPPPR